MFSVLIVVLASVTGAALGITIGFYVRSKNEERARAFIVERDRFREVAERERRTLILEAEVAAREEALRLRSSVEEEFKRRQVELSEQETLLARRSVLLEGEGRAITESRKELTSREAPLLDLEVETKRARTEIEQLRVKARLELERRAHTTSALVMKALVEQAIEDARASGESLIRSASEGGSSNEVIRGAKRLMGIACGRIVDRFQSDRMSSVVMLPDTREKQKLLISETDLQRLAVATSMELSYTHEQDGIRIEGLDGIGREVARRCLLRMFRRGNGGNDSIEKLAKETFLILDRETIDTGRRAFAILKIPVAHREIVALVGRLFYRTSYQQNQWEHAIESGFLCSMMAAELGLDVRLARRAALMHDIGKALTHTMEGSHALIGADYARRLGELEVVANAIGSHHTEEPFASTYAYLVTAADAMSGGRPGSRRQSDENHMAKLSEMERIARGFRGVAEAFAVQGGREVRTYVDADRISDDGAIRLAGDIAKAISAEMTFPGQIKITVIREVLAVELAS